MGRLRDEFTIHEVMATIHANAAKKGLMLRTGRAVGATIIDLPNSTKVSTGERDPAMHQI